MPNHGVRNWPRTSTVSKHLWEFVGKTKIRIYNKMNRLWTAKLEGSQNRESGGLGSSHTAPCGTAVPARPPTH